MSRAGFVFYCLTMQRYEGFFELANILHTFLCAFCLFLVCALNQPLKVERRQSHSICSPRLNSVVASSGDGVFTAKYSSIAVVASCTVALSMLIVTVVVISVVLFGLDDNALNEVCTFYFVDCFVFNKLRYLLNHAPVGCYPVVVHGFDFVAASRSCHIQFQALPAVVHLVHVV